MNNSFLTEKYAATVKVDKTIAPELIARDTQVLAMIGALKQTRAYQDFLELFIAPEIERTRKRLERESDPSAMYRLQGAIDGLRIYETLDNIEGFLRGRVSAYGKDRK